MIDFIKEHNVYSLIATLQNKDADLRAKAVKRFSQIPTIEYITDVLQKHDWEVQSAALELGEREQQFFMVLYSIAGYVADLRNENLRIRSSAVEALGIIGDHKAIQPLIKTLNDESQILRRKAAEALGKIGDLRAVEPLIAALRDNDFGVRSSAAKALQNIKKSS